MSRCMCTTSCTSWEFRGRTEALSRDWRSSSPVRTLEQGLEEFEASSRHGVGITGVRAQFEAWSIMEAEGRVSDIHFFSAFSQVFKYLKEHFLPN